MLIGAPSNMRLRGALELLVAATSAWFDAVAAGTENAHMQSAESCN